LVLNSNGAAESPTGTDENLERELSGRAAEAYDTFLAARHAYFTAVSGQGDERAGGADTGDLLVSEAIDFERVREVLVAYAEAYAELVAAQSLQVERSTDDTRGAALVTLARLQQIDCAAITIADGLGQRDTVLLVSPTHPLR